MCEKQKNRIAKRKTNEREREKIYDDDYYYSK